MTTGRRNRAALVAAAGAAGAAAFGALPWAASGEADRSAYELARTVDALDITSAGVRVALTLAVAVMPAVALGSILATALGATRLAAASAAAAAIVAGGVAVAVAWSPLTTRLGLPMSVASAAVALVGAVFAVRQETASSCPPSSPSN